MARKFPVSVPVSNRTAQLTNRNLTAAINRGRLVAERARELAGERHRLIRSTAARAAGSEARS